MELKQIFAEHAETVESRFKDLGLDVGVLKESFAQLEQKLAQRGSAAGGFFDEKAASWGQQFVDSEGLKHFAEERQYRPGRYRMDIKAVVTSAAGSAGGMSAPYRDQVVSMPRRSVRVRDLLPSVPITTGSVEYPKQTTRTHAAAMVAEGALKPESAYGFTMQTVTPKVIAHWVPASVQILEDAPQLAGIIDTELRDGLQLAEDGQLLFGSGTGENLTGLATQATAYAAPITVAGATMLDQLALAMLQATLGNFAPNGIVLHPSDWMRIRLLKDADGKYLLGEPGSQVEPRLFGLPVAATPAMQIDKFIVGDFNAAATLYDRWEPRVEVSTEDGDNFRRNLVTIRAEERIALAVKQDGALIYGDFGNVA